jgi:hypothetical protein
LPKNLILKIKRRKFLITDVTAYRLEKD